MLQSPTMWRALASVGVTVIDAAYMQHGKRKISPKHAVVMGESTHIARMLMARTPLGGSFAETMPTTECFLVQDRMF